MLVRIEGLVSIIGVVNTLSAPHILRRMGPRGTSVPSAAAAV
ncbi:hypothetical protein PMI03_03156, partial [Rhizobium sp. AP16]